MSKQAVKPIKKVKSMVVMNPMLQDSDAQEPMDRHEMISREAYLRAAQRDFKGGDPLEDWLTAEAEIDGVPGH